MYDWLKLLHVSCAALSISLVVWRWRLPLNISALPQRRWLRLLPHINDTLLLAAAIAMVSLSAQYPFVAPWLTAKLLGLLAYILLGTIALRSRRLALRRSAGLAALVTAAYIVSVAFSKNPRGFLDRIY